MSTFSRHTRLSALLLCGTSLFVTTHSWAQQANTDVAASETGMEEDSGSVEQIVVTGSRIRRSSLDSPAPIAVVGAEAIRATGQTEIANVVNELPGLAITQTDQTSNLAGNAGINALDLRGLGTQRTLVLVDSRRRVPAIPGTSAVDISTIPSSLVERVEIVTGGASALYGADAVAGVANFILKKDFEGIDAGGQYSNSTRGDLDEYSFDFLAGKNFADGRGNVTVYGFYETSPNTVSGEDRPWTAGGYPIYSRSSTSEPYTIQDGVRNVNNSRYAHVILGGKLYTFTDEGVLRAPQLGPGGFVNRGEVDLSDPASIGTLLTDGGEYGGRYDAYYLTVPSDRLSTRLAVNYEFDKALKLSISGEYSHNKAEAAYAPLTAFGTDTIPADSPFITDEMRAANGGAIDAPVNFSRRFDELGTARNRYDRKLYQLVTSLEGDFSLFNHDWNYSSYYSYGRSRQKEMSVNGTAMNRFYDAIDSTSDAAGNAICRSTLTDPSNGCVALNPFKPLTQEMIDYIQYDAGPAISTLTQHVVSGYVSGGLFDLPGGAVQLVLGAEYRKERNDIGVAPELDPTNPAFDPTIGSTATPLVGGYSVKEVFGELHIPISLGCAFRRDALD
ncbi:TonB-dependent receptor plug domain-containing protein [Pedomonas mirosovicensis]|uniref:TonB-dependent receptor plug domain-containing protein n=1 Tax=Pedomonas mirosovicensis TaxID=2908641 RepID=UPI0021672E76|nr:TonB-dependent receptor plug domain-containing protein [Pedomonas mirosovicensis]MCH8686652.1 TonB-dependent receptor plug domain-containing protein [Pedomonas mirosovicensis]